MDWELAKEATEVGALLVPVYAIVREALDGMKFKNETNKEYWSVACLRRASALRGACRAWTGGAASSRRAH